MVALVVVALVASLLALAPTPVPAGAQDTDPVTTTTSWPTDCVGIALNVRQQQTNSMSFDVTAPAQVAPNDVFTIRIAPNTSAFPDKNPSPLGEVTVNRLLNINFMYNLPTNATVQSVAIVPGSGFGTAGTPTVSVDDSYTPARIVLKVPEVPKNMTPPTNETFFELPAIDITVQATGPIGSNVATRFAGRNEATSGYVFQADSLALADVFCWPVGEVPAPLMSQTAISSGSVTNPTTTELSVDPTVVPGGYDVTMTATVNAPSGVVRFNDGPTILGYAELDDTGTATLTAPLNTLGQRSITASYLGAPSFEASTSEPVVVTVTNPAARSNAQISVVPSPADVGLGNTGLTGPANVTVTLVAPPGDPETPTGAVTLYLDDTQVGSGTLTDGSVAFPVTVPTGGHQLRAEYVGDVNFFAATGTAPITARNNTSSNSLTANRPLTGSLTLNGLTGAIPGGSSLTSTFRTDGSGVQNIGGTLLVAEGTYTIPGGSITGRLAQTGPATGSIQAGPDAPASLETELFFQVTSADFGSGPRAFGSSCVIGPIAVDLEGTRAGTNGALTLGASGVQVPALPAGSCITPSGNSLASQVSTAVAGFATDIELTLTPPAAAVAVNIAPVTVTPGITSFGQPATLQTTISTDGGPSFPSNAGDVFFYRGEELLGSVLTVGSGATRTVSLTLPNAGDLASSPKPPLPQGESVLRAQFVPRPQSKNIFATSPLSDPTTYEVLPPVPKTATTLTMEVPEAVQAGEPVTVNFQLSPVPGEVDPSLPPLGGTIQVFDLAEPDPLRQLIPIAAGVFGEDKVMVPAGSGGSYSGQIALTPGVHELKAVFTPDLNAAWWWASSETAPASHTVLGEAIPTSIEIIGDGTRGTGKTPQGFSFNVDMQLDPAVVASMGPFQAHVFLANPEGGVPLSVATVQPDGRVSLGVGNASMEPGTYEVTFIFDPSLILVGTSFPNLYAGNRGFAPTAVTYSFEIVRPGDPDPLPTNTEVVSVDPSPAEQGVAWNGINGFVSVGAEGTVRYVARSLATGEATILGDAWVSSFDGSAFLWGPVEPSASLAAGAYDVIGIFTPMDPALAEPSTSDPLRVTITTADDPIETQTQLGVFPEGPTAPGAGVLLEALVTPSEATMWGSVEFFDGETSLGVFPVTNGFASTLRFDLAEGTHSLRAQFISANPLVEGSTSNVVEHVVADPAIPTTTELAVSPEGESLQGEEVTLTATVEPEGAAGVVVFEDEHGELGEVAVTDGQAVLVVDDLEAGEHEITATFEPADPEAYASSTSDPVAHFVIAQAVPEAPDGVTATEGGLMATVTWVEPEGSQPPVTSYTVTVSPGGREVTVSAAVTTVDIIGLTAEEEYSFTVVATNAVGDSEPSEPSNTVTVLEPTKEFSDVSPNHAFYNEIIWMSEVGLSRGFDDGTYGPALPLTRQAMSAFVYRMAGSPDGADPTCTTAPFPDVPVTNPFCGEIQWMKDEGISTGKVDGTFGPGDTLTRQAMAAFLYRLAGEPDGTDPTCSTPPFNDVPVTNPFCGEIQWMKETGISTGTQSGDFLPEGTLTRGAMSAFLYRYTLVVQTEIV